ncbi:Alpha/beta hydrolase fold-1 [Aspergillus cavernicola]|uniref:Alpha/beta hydrolase fold-1 n=1 Tax=Aspergillus cavernicola TaxID=176166 RepID=A0ABR4IMN8_9EURO
MTPPTIVLIHGGWHTPALYEKLTSHLKSLGHEVHVPRLPSMNGARPPNADLFTDTALIRGYVESLADAGRDIVVLMHSYGGQVGTHALLGLGAETRRRAQLQQQKQQRQWRGGGGGGVVRLVYVAAFALGEGESMIGMVKEMGDEALILLAFDFAEDGTVLDRDPGGLLVGPGLEEEELEGYVGRFERWNGTGMYQGLEGCAWREIPVSYVCTKNDMTVPFGYQQVMIGKLRGEGKEVETFELATGHCPQLTMPKELGEIVHGIVCKEEESSRNHADSTLDEAFNTTE